MTGRLDNFTDAAFAFAVSLLVIGGGGALADFDLLVRALGVVIWLILAGTGIASIFISLTPFGRFAAFAYSTIPLTIGLFVARYDWTGGKAAE